MLASPKLCDTAQRDDQMSVAKTHTGEMIQYYAIDRVQTKTAERYIAPSHELRLLAALPGKLGLLLRQNLPLPSVISQTATRST